MMNIKSNTQTGPIDRKNYFKTGCCEALDKISSFEYQMILDYMCWQGIEFDSKNILVLGCGNGYLEEKILQRFKVKNITLLDASEECLNNAKNKCICANIVCMELASFDSTKFDDFDLIYSVNVMQYLKEKEIIKLNKKLLNCLSDNGFIYHMGIPDKNRKWIYRIDQTLIHHSFKYLVGKHDFVDCFSYWHKRRTFLVNENKVLFFTPSLRNERFDVKIHHKTKK